ncbi:acetyl-CoA carboxylase biotin carboxyl carrier protein [candidate division KSB1 bacterium]|nr:acetyl-CoA carboxylase biotin carboxyl carrier protein [candidate division KSB1 bacterium]
MNPKEIQKLIELVEKSSVNELEVNRWGRKVIIRKQSGNHAMVSIPNEQVFYASNPAAPVQPAAAPAPQPAAPAPTPAKDYLVEVRSPMVGTLYRAPAPDAAPYVKEGDKVNKGQVLCIIEAMKLMNEIEAEFPFKIVEILVENGQPVEYDQPLFKVEKA